MMGTQPAYKLLVGALLCDALRSEHQKRGFDIVEAAEWEALALPLLVRPIVDLPVMVQIHLGYAAHCLGNSIPPHERDDLAEALELACIVGADAVCAATQSVVDVTRRICPFDRKVTIIPYPVAIDTSQSMASPPGNGAALFVGRLHRRKGCDVLAAAADIFLGRNPLATVRVAGSDTKSSPPSPSMLAEMMQRIDPSVRDRFIYLGELSQGELRREIQACRFQIVPSVVENFANTAIDAMAMGRLVIYGGNTGLDEVVGDAGIRVWPLTAAVLAQKMELAWRDCTLAEEYGKRAVNRLRTQFDAATVSHERVKFYEKVIADHRSEPRDQNRQWEGLSGAQTRAVLAAMIAQMSGTVGIEPETPTPGMMLTARLKELSQRLARPPIVWLFGAGRYTLRLLGERYRWQSLGLRIAGIIDEHPRFEDSPVYLGFQVEKPANLCAAIKAGQAVDAIVLSTDTLEGVFRERVQCFADLGVEILTLSAKSWRMA
jgi:glycosyltransferase involved in cell wall biosynthesis